MTPLVAILAFYVSLINSNQYTPLILKDYVALEATISGVDVSEALHIADAESGFNPDAVGDHGTSIGMWQIHLPAHAVSPQNARSVVYSTEWAMTQLKAGNCKIWSTCDKKANDGS